MSEYINGTASDTRKASAAIIRARSVLLIHRSVPAVDPLPSHPVPQAGSLGRVALVKRVLVDPTSGLLVGPLDVRLAVVPPDALDPAAADLEVPEVAAADQGVCLGHADGEFLGDLFSAGSGRE
jgi:hypothetical protein